MKMRQFERPKLSVGGDDSRTVGFQFFKGFVSKAQLKMLQNEFMPFKFRIERFVVTSTAITWPTL